jgi:hypothetical protein
VSDYDINLKKAEDELLPLLTDDFLETLRLAVKTCGWSVDHIESARFVGWCYDLAEKEAPETEPFVKPF